MLGPSISHPVNIIVFRDKKESINMRAVMERNVRTSNVESDCSADDIEAAWDAEVDRRLQEVLDGTAELVSSEESMRKLDALLTAVG